jgi:hypothetical protein
MQYTSTSPFPHFDAKPLVVQSDSTPTVSFNPDRREPVYTAGYPSAFEVAAVDVLHITIVKNPTPNV